MEPIAIDVFPLSISPDSDVAEVLCTYHQHAGQRQAGALQPQPRVEEQAGAAGVVVAARVKSSSAQGGSLMVVGTDGVTAEVDPSVKLPVESQIDTSLPTPYPMGAFVRGLLDRMLRDRAVTLSASGTGLTSTACRFGPGNYSLLVTNPSLNESLLGGSVRDRTAFVSNVGSIVSVAEVELDQSEKNSTGYLPQGYENATLGHSTDTSMAGADARLFEIIVNETAKVVGSTPSLPRGQRHVGLQLPSQGGMVPFGGGSLMDAVRLRPTFFHHYDTIVVDWRWVEDTEPGALGRAGAWAEQQKLRIMVDFSNGVNLYPDLRLVRNSVPENYYSSAQSKADFALAVRRLGGLAKRNGQTLHLRVDPQKMVGTVEEAWGYVSAEPAWKIAASVGLMLLRGISTASQLEALLEQHGVDKARIGVWFVGAPVMDPLTGSAVSVTGSLAGSAVAAAAGRALTATTPDAVAVIDVALDPDGGKLGFAELVDAEYIEVSALEGLGETSW